MPRRKDEPGFTRRGFLKMVGAWAAWRLAF